MRSPVIVAALFVAASAVAYAQPHRESVPTRSETSTGRFSLDAKPTPRRRVAAPRRVDGWAELADATPTKFGTVFVVVGGARTGSFGTLRVDALAGKVAIRTVKVFFVDGTEKSFTVAKTLDRKRRKSTVIDLGGAHAINRIVITTSAAIRGEYAIYGNESFGSAKTTCC